jgi:hypothetical protein
MIKSVLSVALISAALLVSANAQAKQEVQVTRTVWELSDFPALEKSAKAVCEGKATMSDKLKTACKDAKFPRVTKAGAFYNNGIGAELNTLIRQNGATAEAPAAK